ncbi:PREDICTED: uncharacterized protein LOC104778548 [Camelina sativa]|uniref:tRNA-uridine aminocarboxypropyltransferase n=1 Tax=Camelina sativa TaxID=90675 RepID=A0ABM1RHY1_CAMSA|nr:PREDICTED: uncharacterized protein LOC104778548 [Camelina sativa]
MPEVLACYGGLHVFIYQAVWFCGNRYVFGFICILGIFYARTTRASYCGRYLASNPLHSASLESLKTKRSCGMNSSVQEKTESVEVTFSVKDTFGSSASENPGSSSMTDEDKTLHFILLDGTWNNSAAMLKRLKDHAKSVWGDEDLPCISLAAGASAMHKLRPQPSWDRTCTAAAAIGLLTELSLLPQLSSYELDKQADAVEEGLVILLDSLTGRRLRMGRSITRKGRNTISIC